MWIVAVLLGLLAIAAIALIRPDADRDNAIAEFTQSDSHFVILPDGTRVHLRISGESDGVPVVLLHGFASSAWAWDGWTSRLAPDYRVIRVDLPGHGLTFLPRNAGPNAVSAEFLAQTLDALHIERAVIAGNSMGGGLAGRFAEAHPERVLALILVDAPPPNAGPPARVREMTHAWYAPLLRFGFRWAGGSLIMRYGMSVGGGKGAPVTDAAVHRADVFWRLHRREILHAAAPGAAAPRFDAARITAPVLIMQGAEDKLVPRTAAEAWAAALPHAQLMILPGLGHTPHEEDPARTAEDVRVFLRGNGLGGG